MKARVSWLGDKTFVGQNETGHSIVLGTATDTSLKPGPSSMELVLIGAAGCSAWDVVNILEKGREAIEDCVVEMDADRADSPPKVFVRVHMHFVVRGRNLSPAKVERAVQLSVEKYCSASKMVEKTAVMTHDFEIVDTAEGS